MHDEEEGVSTADEDLSAGDTQDDTLTSGEMVGLTGKTGDDKKKNYFIMFFVLK